LLLLLPLAPPARAAGSIEVLANKQSAVFAKTLTFSLRARATSPIQEVILFYGRDGERLVRRIYPQFVASPQITVEHTEEIEAGQFAPGTMLRAYWRLRAADGTTLTTPPILFEYAHDAFAWKSLAGQNVDLYYYKDAAKAQDLLKRAEEAVTRIAQQINVPLKQRLSIYVYDSRADMSQALSKRSEGYDERVTTLGVAVDERTLLLLGTHRDVNQTVAHELTHLVVHLATDNPYASLPRWLDEGLAMVNEGELPSGNKRALDAGIRANKLLSVRSMTSYSGMASQVDLYYGQAFSIATFMLKEGGAAKMQQLLAVFAKGTRQEEALQAVYGFGLDELDTRWRASLGLGPRREPTPKAQGLPGGLRIVLPSWLGGVR
jgi:hypothetical protein